MFEVILLVCVVVLFGVLYLVYSSWKERKLVRESEKTLVSVGEQLKIAERRFMQGKIRKNVFDALIDDLEQEKFSAELTLYRVKKSPEISVVDKVNYVLDKLDKPTKHRSAKIEKILKETELLRHEIGLLENKLLKREIKQSVFEKMIKEQESKLIKKERELNLIVNSSPKEKFKQEV